MEAGRLGSNPGPAISHLCAGGWPLVPPDAQLPLPMGRGKELVAREGSREAQAELLVAQRPSQVVFISVLGIINL